MTLELLQLDLLNSLRQPSPNVFNRTAQLLELTLQAPLRGKQRILCLSHSRAKRIFQALEAPLRFRRSQKPAFSLADTNADELLQALHIASCIGTIAAGLILCLLQPLPQRAQLLMHLVSILLDVLDTRTTTGELLFGAAFLVLKLLEPLTECTQLLLHDLQCFTARLASFRDTLAVSYCSGLKLVEALRDLTFQLGKPCKSVLVLLGRSLEDSQFLLHVFACLQKFALQQAVNLLQALFKGRGQFHLEL
mmetsp:Transcript_5763/g.10389  ORF Transcript_5763/g.10389 Transcript_5763/m.10389 type:complete len:250 (-) Transcript_5763:650-1399(-)